MKEFYRIIKSLFIAAVVVALITACGKQPQASTGGDNYLKYAFNTEGSISYVSSSTINQLIIAGGQEVAADVLSTLSYSVTKTGSENNSLKLNIKVDSIYSSVKSMQGNMVSNPEEVKGKEFSMLLSENGEESGLEEAAEIEFTGVSGEKSNLKASFALVFPDLPEGVVAKVGYTWTDNDTIDMSVSGQTVLLILNSKNTIVAKERFNGYDCYKIEYSNTGERHASGDTPQGFMSTSGDLTGGGYLYFAYKEGILVKDQNEQKFDGDLTLPTGDAFPMYMDIKFEVDLQKQE